MKRDYTPMITARATSRGFPERGLLLHSLLIVITPLLALVSYL